MTPDPLGRVRIASPCIADWNAMVGDEQVRFCQHCQKRVYNLLGDVWTFGTGNWTYLLESGEKLHAEEATLGSTTLFPEDRNVHLGKLFVRGVIVDPGYTRYVSYTVHFAYHAQSSTITRWFCLALPRTVNKLSTR